MTIPASPTITRLRTDMTFEGEVLLNEHTSRSAHMVKHIRAVEAAAAAEERERAGQRLGEAIGALLTTEGRPHKIKRGEAGYPGWEVNLLVDVTEVLRIVDPEYWTRDARADYEPEAMPDLDVGEQLAKMRKEPQHG